MGMTVRYGENWRVRVEAKFRAIIEFYKDFNWDNPNNNPNNPERAIIIINRVIMLWLGDLSQSVDWSGNQCVSDCTEPEIWPDTPSPRTPKSGKGKKSKKGKKTKSPKWKSGKGKKSKKGKSKKGKSKKGKSKKGKWKSGKWKSGSGKSGKVSLEKERRKHRNHQREKERQEHGLVLVPDLVHTLDPAPVLEAENDVQLKRLNLSKNQELRDIEDQALVHDQDHGQEVERNTRKKAKRRVNIQKQNH